MTHEEIQDLLEGYVDETLDRDTRRVVDDHLSTCDECQAILDDVAPVDLGSMATGSFDERGLRRSVRRAMRRTVFDAVLVLIAAWLGLWFLAAAVLQPVLVNRGNRAGEAVQAIIDSAVMFNPGAQVTDIDIQSSGLERRVDVDLGMQVGAAVRSIGTVSGRVGVVGVGDVDGGKLFPFVQTQESSAVDASGLRRLGESTVSTVSVMFPDGISVADAQAFAESSGHDVRVVWAGFGISDQPPFAQAFEPGGVVGYGTCGVPDIDPQMLRASSAGGSFGSGYERASIASALEETRRAVANLAGSDLAGALIERDLSSPDRIDAALRYLSASEPSVVMLVVTGPSVEVAGFVEDVGTDAVQLLSVDFYDWSTPVCGR